jgi:hypothetical protein
MVKNMMRIITLVLLIVVNSPMSLAQEKKPYGESYERGKVEAADNIEKEIYVIKVWGLPSSTFYAWPSREDIYQSILKEKYKVSFEWVGGCLVDEETSDYADGYNIVSLAGIEAKYGKGILAYVRKLAEAEYEIKYGEKEREYDKRFKAALKSLPKRNKE